MNDFPSAAYDAWKTTPPEGPERLVRVECAPFSALCHEALWQLDGAGDAEARDAAAEAMRRWLLTIPVERVELTQEEWDAR